jgi:RHS repeat-associated protein
VPSASELATMAGITREGFTGHEHLDSTGLVHMNGRVYDPQLGRFISADPYVDGPESTQGWNRYSYVHNRPLSFDDPSGFGVDDQPGEVKLVLPIDPGWSQTALSPLTTAAIKAVVLTMTCAMGACPVGILFAATWQPANSNGQSSSPATQSWSNFPSAAGMAGFEPEIRKRPTPARSPPPVARRTVANPSSSTDFPAVAAGPSALLVFLDVVSATNIPVASEAAGFTSAVMYAVGGDWVGAGLAVVGVVPVIGTTADAARLSKHIRLKLNGPAATRFVGPSLPPALDTAQELISSAGGVIRHFRQQAEQIYYRVYSANAVGKWLTAVRPRSSAWAREALSLPPGNAATFLQEVRVPSGTLLERSRALPVEAWGRFGGGAEQYQLLEEIPLSSFGPGVPLP